MSYFKPLNSNENNLHIIRASIDNTGKITKPSINQLPSSFSVQQFNDNGNGKAYLLVNYSGIFNSSDIPSILIETESNINTLSITNKTNTQCTITSSGNTIPILDIVIIGTKLSGPVFAVSNRGWKYSTNSFNDNLLYSDMIVGIGTDDPKYNLSITGNIGIIPNIIKSSNVITSKLLNYYLNIIDIDNSNITISLPESSNNGQLLNICIGNIDINDRNVVFDMNSNIIITNTQNLVLQNKGDTINLCSYNKKWIVTNKNIQPIPNVKINYNNILSSGYDNNTFSTLTNGKLNIFKIDSNINISLPSSSINDGIIIDMIVGNIINPFVANVNVNNLITNKTSIILSKNSDKLKLLGYESKWLVLDN
jgi:hypothetical protein